MTEQRDVIAQPDTVPIGAALSGAASASFCGALVTGVVSWLIWREPWWEAVLAIAVLPFAVVWLGSLGYAVRVAVSWNVRPKQQIEVVASNTKEVRFIDQVRKTIIDSKPMPVDSRDLVMFITQSCAPGVMDWTQTRWEGTVMESGRKCDTRYHAALMNVLTKTGVIEGYGKGTTGHMAVPTVSDALSRVGLQTG